MLLEFSRTTLNLSPQAPPPCSCPHQTQQKIIMRPQCQTSILCGADNQRLLLLLGDHEEHWCGVNYWQTHFPASLQSTNSHNSRQTSTSHKHPNSNNCTLANSSYGHGMGSNRQITGDFPNLGCTSTTANAKKNNCICDTNTISQGTHTPTALSNQLMPVIPPLIDCHKNTTPNNPTPISVTQDHDMDDQQHHSISPTNIITHNCSPALQTSYNLRNHSIQIAVSAISLIPRLYSQYFVVNSTLQAQECLYNSWSSPTTCAMLSLMKPLDNHWNTIS